MLSRECVYNLCEGEQVCVGSLITRQEEGEEGREGRKEDRCVKIIFTTKEEDDSKETIMKGISESREEG